MSDYMPPRPHPVRTYAAVAVFLAVYALTLLIVVAPRDMIAAQSGSIIREAD